MALSNERANELAMQWLQKLLEKEGIKLKPSETKREMSNLSKKMGIPVAEAAEFAKIFFEKAYSKTIAELDKIISGKVEG